jgi:hypothetical protein
MPASPRSAYSSIHGNAQRIATADGGMVYRGIADLGSMECVTIEVSIAATSNYGQ